MVTFDEGGARGWIECFIGRLDERLDELSDLDRRMGDGDYGFNMRSALRRVSGNLQRDASSSPENVFSAVSNGFLTTGGTSGPLFGMWFREFAKALKGGVSINALNAAASNGTAVVQELGKAEVGHKTMVDAMVPAAKALADAKEKGDQLQNAFYEAARAAERGANSTAKLVAQRGRASYIGDRSQGVIDPGAVTVAVFFGSAVAV